MNKDLRIKEEENHLTRIRERAEKLKNSINDLKRRGLTISSNEPIEGKMYW